MEIAVLGAGAMGCLFGAGLFEAGHQVTLVDVNPDQVRTLDERGLVVEGGAGRKVLPIPACFPNQVPGPPDLLILFTKTFHTEAALAGAKGWIGPQTRVLSLQNGLGNVDAIGKFVDPSRIIVGVTTFPSDLEGTGRIRTRGSGVTRIMAADGQVSGFLRDVSGALDGAGFRCEISEGVTASIWEKVAFNAAMNGLTSVTGLTVGQVGSAADGAELAARVVEEVVGVARRKGIPADPEAVERAVAEAFREHTDHKPSMLQDVLGERRTEVESIHGAVVREARELGLAVPVTETLYRLVKTMEANYPKAGGNGELS